MALNLQDKQAIVAEVSEVAKGALSAVVADSRGVTVTNVARREERVDTVIRLFQQTAQRRDKRNMLAEEVKILHIAGFRLLQGDGASPLLRSLPAPAHRS